MVEISCGFLTFNQLNVQIMEREFQSVVTSELFGATREQTVKRCAVILLSHNLERCAASLLRMPLDKAYAKVLLMTSSRFA